FLLRPRPPPATLHRSDHLDLRLRHRTIPRISPMTSSASSDRQGGLHRTDTPPSLTRRRSANSCVILTLTSAWSGEPTVVLLGSLLIVARRYGRKWQAQRPFQAHQLLFVAAICKNVLEF